MDKTQSSPPGGGIPGLFLLSEPSSGEELAMMDAATTQTTTATTNDDTTTTTTANGTIGGVDTNGEGVNTQKTTGVEDINQGSTGASDTTTTTTTTITENSAPVLSKGDFWFALGADTALSEGGRITHIKPEEQIQDSHMQEAQEDANTGPAVKEEEGKREEGDTGPPEAETALHSAVVEPAPVTAEDTTMGDDTTTTADANADANPDAAFQAAALANKSQPGAEWELDSDASSSDDSSDSDSSSDAGSSDYDLLDPSSLAALLMDEASDHSDTETHPAKHALKTKNEIPESSLPIALPTITLTPTTPITLLGTIQTILPPIILIAANTPGDHRVLSESSLLCTSTRTILGTVSDILGRVESPLYTVRFNTPSELAATEAKVGDEVFYVPDHSTYVFTAPLRAQKGSDASNLYDEEVPEAEREFSDDEKEAEAKRNKKMKGAGPKTGEKRRADGRAAAAAAAEKGVAAEEPYVPLARPANLHEMLAAGAAGVAPQGQGQGQGRGRGGRNQHNRGNRSGQRGRGGNSAGNISRDHHLPHQQQPQYPPQYPHPHPQQQYQFSPPPPLQQQQQWPTPPIGPYAPYAPFSPQLQGQNFYPSTLPQGAHVNPAFFQQHGWAPQPPPPQSPQPPQGQQQQGQGMIPEAFRALQNLLSLSKAAQQGQQGQQGQQ